MRALPIWKKLVFAFVPLFAVLGIAEAVARIERGTLFTLENHRLRRLDLARRENGAVPHPLLGWAPKPGYTARDDYWKNTVTIDPDGFRSNGSSPPAAGGSIVAVGDSFTFGSQVDDDESWPAYLEALLDRRVRNGGVGGYSLGQAVLRAEEILKRVPAEWLVLSFIPDDINRCEFSKRYAAKPYFDVVRGELVLRNVPPRADVTAEELRLRRFKNALGYSGLAHAAFKQFAEEWWYLDEKQVRVHPEGTGLELAKRLVERAASLCEDAGCNLMLVLQGGGVDPAANALLEHARFVSVEVLDLVARFLEAERTAPGLRKRYFHHHMTAEGNRWVASEIAERITAIEAARRLGLPPGGTRSADR